MNILAGIENDPRFARAAALIHAHDNRSETHPMTGDNTGAPAAPAPRQPRTISQAIHSSLLHMQAEKNEVVQRIDGVTAAIHRALPLIERIVTNPELDELVEAALRALDAGVAAGVVQGATDMLRSAIDRQAQASGGNPTLAAIADQAGTGAVTADTPPPGLTVLPSRPPLSPPATGDAGTHADPSGNGGS